LLLGPPDGPRDLIRPRIVRPACAERRYCCNWLLLPAMCLGGSKKERKKSLDWCVLDLRFNDDPDNQSGSAFVVVIVVIVVVVCHGPSSQGGGGQESVAGGGWPVESNKWNSKDTKVVLLLASSDNDGR